MAKSTQYLFTNTSDSLNTLTLKALGLVNNYALSEDSSNTAILNNKTAPIDAMEIVTFRSRDIAKVNTDLAIAYPPKVTKGIQYGVQVEETLVTTDSDDTSFRVDEPIVVSINVRHQKSGNITNDLVGAAVLRAVSSLVRSDGTWRFDDLMRSAERPVVD
jgi:hypothetical protein